MTAGMTTTKSKTMSPESRFSQYIASPFAVPAVLLLLTLAMFGDVLVHSATAVLSFRNNDLALEFYYWRQFGFTQLKAGHLALWNPYVFSGTPFLGGWQAELLYPFDWMYLILPLNLAINCEIALHVFIAGLGTSLWVRANGMHPGAALLAGVMVMFGGTYFPHIYAGHLSTLDTMAWVPFVLLAIDGLMESVGRGAALRYGLLAAFALAMEILSGHPQTMFNTLVMCGIYLAIRMLRDPKRWTRVVLFGLVGVGAGAISAAQIVAGLAAAAEGTRRHGVPYSFASMFSFPPENFLTALAPNVFGSESISLYWGRCYLWETCLYMGIAGIALAVFGLIRGTSRLRGTWLAMIIILLVVALGGHTPLFELLYHLPGFNTFRSHSKFIYEASLFLAIAAAAGLDAFLCGAGTRSFAISVAVLGLLLLCLGATLELGTFGTTPGSPWDTLTSANWLRAESQAQPSEFQADDFLERTQKGSGTALLIAGTVALLLAGLAVGAGRQRRLVYGMAALGIAELCVFARSTIVSFNPARTAIEAPIRQYLDEHPGNFRVLQVKVVRCNEVMDVRRDDIWGYDPTVLGRYAEFMAFSEGLDPDQASMYVNIDHADRMMRLFRLRTALINQNGELVIAEDPAPLPQAMLVNQEYTLENRDEILSAMRPSGFDCSQTVFLETAPDPAPSPQTTGTIDVRDDSPGVMTVTADLTGSAIAVVTDSYSRDWHATPLSGSSQSSYTVLPADYAAIGIPLAAGHHRFRLSYMPDGFQTAEFVSAAASAVFLVLTVIVIIPKRRGAQST